MLSLTALKTNELLGIYNGRCPDAPITSWKSSKEKLVAKLALVINPAADVPQERCESALPISDKPTVGNLATQLLLAKDALGQPFAYDFILSRIKAEFPEAKTTSRSLASVASQLRRQGYSVARRGS